MTQILKNRKGITLVELIVGLMLTSIITAAVSVILPPMLRTYARANEFAECNTLLDIVANQIIGDLANATTPPVPLLVYDEIEFSIGSDYVKYTIDTDDASANKGVLLKSDDPAGTGIPVLAKTYYKNKSVSFICKPARDPAEADPVKAYTLTVIVSSDRDGEEMLSRDYSVRPLTLPGNQY